MGMVNRMLAKLRERFPVQTEHAKNADNRIAIAKDVLAVLDANRMIAMTGNYVRGGDLPQYAEESFEALALAIRNPKSRVSCEVCAIGAAAISAVGLYDRAEPIEEGDWGVEQFWFPFGWCR